ncbi:MAG TPA: queuosine salvage family protein [Thermomicrobiales bacterium]|nr:queuosine salvage family protein [Thermomicrobiales bacterium]
MTLRMELDLSRDPLRVLESTLPIVEGARLVRIDRQQVQRAAALIEELPDPRPDWDRMLHPTSDDHARLANLVLVVDALNFCFWSLPSTGRPRWQVTYDGTTYDGYAALAVALRRAVEGGEPLWDGDHLGTITESEVAALLAGDEGSDPIPLLRARMEHLREVGVALVERWEGTFLHAIRAARGSAPKLIAEVLRALPSFRDTVPWGQREARFYKRAQILVADVYGAFAGQGPGAFHDLDTLTAFADYKVPQVLRQFGVLSYAPELAERIARFELIPPESDEELEIRASTVWAVELLRQELGRRGRPMPAYAIDWALWQAGQSLPETAEPYHRTLTVYY